MKSLIILGTLALSLPAIAVQDKDYQYKDLNTTEARPFNGKASSLGSRTHEQLIQKQETRKETRRVKAKRIEDESRKAY